jgi:hypothetical protein
MPTILPDLAVKRYTEFITSFNKFKLVEHEIDITKFDFKEKLLTFYNRIDTDEKLFNYLLNKDKLLFHKNYKLSFINKINLFTCIINTFFLRNAAIFMMFAMKIVFQIKRYVIQV